jgi:hypothetical protein
VDEVAPLEIQPEEYNVTQIADHHQDNDLTFEDTNNSTDECHNMDEEEDKEDDGSDFYFSLPPTTGSSMSAVDYFTSMGVEVGEVADVEEITAVMESEEEDASLPMGDNIVSIITEDLVVHERTNDVEAAIATECVPPTPPPTAAVLGSIWLPDPKHGVVRRSARFRARG